MKHYGTQNVPILSLSAITESAAATETLKFTINGEKEAADIDALKAEGYDVEFLATKAVFDGQTAKNGTGTLDASATGTFSYKVVIKKDGAVVKESELKEVTVVSATSIVQMKAEIQDGSGVAYTSGKVAIDEAAAKVVVTEAVQHNGEKADLSNLSGLTYTSSDPEVALVDTDGTIIPITTGTTTVTIVKDGAKVEVALTVVAETRAAASMTVSESTVKTDVKKRTLV